MGQNNVIRLCRGQRDLHLKLGALYGSSASIQDFVTGTRLGGACVVYGSRAMLVTTKIGVGVNFKALVPFGIKRDSLSTSGLQALHKVDYHISVERYCILREVGVLMHHVGNIRYGALLQEVELPQY